MRIRRTYLTAAALAVPAVAAAFVAGQSLWAAPTAEPVDRTKYVVEQPAKGVLARTAPAPAAPSAPFNNPKVEPGKVRWHKDQGAAALAARRSGKPVLVFLMMGRLDQRFC